MPVRRKRQFPYTVTIDNEPVRLLLTRMKVAEFEEFQAQFIANGQRRGAPLTMAMLTAPAREPQEGETAEPEPPRLTPEEVTLEVAYLKANAAWLADVFDSYVRVVEGDVLDEDEQGNSIVVTNGRQFADMYPGQGFLMLVLLQLYTENVLTDDQKKKLPSRSGSETGSRTAPKPAAAGPTPAPIVESVAPVASVAAEGAMAPSNETSSGTTVRSSFEAAPCVI